MSSDKTTKGIKAIIIFDIIGKPPEYLTETLDKIIKDINDEKGVSVKEKKINEPILIKNQKELFTTFAEIEVEVEEIINLAILMFKYMPAHIEIISPELIILSNNGWTDILSEITRRLHGYEEIARIIQVEKGILEKKLREALENSKEVEKTKKEKNKL